MQVAERGRSGVQLVVITATSVSVALTFSLWVVFKGDWTVACWLALGNCALCGGFLARSWFDPWPGPVALVFWPFMLIWSAVAPLAQLATGVMPWPDYGLDDYFVWAELVTLCAVVMYVLGSRIGPRRQALVRLEQIGHVGRLWLLPPVGLALVWPVLAASGGLAGRFGTRDDLSEALHESFSSSDTVGLFFLNRLPAAIAIVTVYSFAFALRSFNSRNSTWRSIKLWSGLVLALVLVALFANPFSSSRYVFFSALLALCFGLMSFTTALRRMMVSGVFVAGVLLAYPVAKWFKKSSVQGNPVRLGSETFLTIDFDGFQQTVNALSYVSEQGIAYGRHILAALAFFVPRLVWDSKPLPASLDVAAARGYSFLNLSLPLWAEFYVEFGVVGVVLGMLLLGYVSGRLDFKFASASNSLGRHMAALFAACQTGLLRGPLGGSVVTIGTVLVLGWAVYVRTNRKSVRTAAVRLRPTHPNITPSVEPSGIVQ